ncbi:cobalt-zinc-cadmium resistance protein, partial [Variovorax sp. CT11-76]
MRTLFVPLAVLALAVPPVFAQPSLPTQQAATGTPTSAASSQASASLEPASPLTLRSALALAFQANPG